jgi:hypothetical protein
MKQAIRVEKIGFDPRLCHYKEEWETLLEQSSRPTIYSSFDYIYTSCIHFKEDEEIYFLFFREASTEELLAIFPISVRNQKFFGVQLVELAYGITAYKSDIDKPYPIIKKEHEAVCWIRYRDYFRRQNKSWDIIVHDELTEMSYLYDHLKVLFPFPFYWTKAKAGPLSPIVSLAGEWDEFWQAHGNMRKKNRRLEKKIGAAFRYCVTSDPADVERCLNEYIAVEAMGYKAGEGVSNEANQIFYHDLLPKLAEKGQVFFGMMYDGAKVISAEISYTYLNRVYFALGTYNPEYASCSPGTVSTSRFIQYFYGKGYAEGDFLAGYAHYVNPWTCCQEKTRDVLIRRMGWKNWYIAFRYAARRIKNKLKTTLWKLRTQRGGPRAT